MKPTKNITLTLALLVASVGCSDADPQPTDDFLAPPPAGSGVQFQLVTTLDPGEEAEHCKFVQVPPEGLIVNRDEIRFTEGSHHFLVYETPMKELPTVSGANADGVYDCSDGPTNDVEITRLIGGSQNGDGTSMLDFPGDVGMTIDGGTVLLLNAHYINATSDVLEPEARVNLWTIDESDRVHEGDILFLYNIFINVPGQMTSRAHMRCPVYDDIILTNAQSHMHARGVGYSAQVTGSDPFYENDRWEDVPVTKFPEGMPVSAGSTLEYWCDYQNSGSDAVRQGPRSTDEMCMLIGSFYPASPATAGCSRDVSAPLDTQNLGAEWVGSGTASCNETMNCVLAALSDDSGFDGIQVCMNDASADISREASAAIGCYFSAEDVTTECAAEIEACTMN